MTVTLVLGGARSGKSNFAEGLVEATAHPIYLATAQAWDGEMTDRIREHRARRGERWTTIEEPLDLAASLARAARPDGAVLVDCLTLWLSNLMGADSDIAQETRRLVDALDGLAGPVVFVSNEVGLGIVPDNALARAFRDHAGRLHQAVAARAQRVYFVVAGIPMTVKDELSNGR
ncbi:MAG TPA: bifunctional adenosylcobinamide kinase/adenosylcobinamide-phosphate guanylyltransferase [Azospirillaceae bacterium]|nr:bifunctional adenosylcobinamide kinase/adenosylcobinamide-phosphate guanylyltransferase [Azospirillaceae bacterium]